MPRLALKFGYNGRAFSGYANQNIDDPPDTVERRILLALWKILRGKEALDLGAFAQEIGFQSASRTDKGVSALGNVVSFVSNKDVQATARALNGLVDDCFFWAGADVMAGFKPRGASSRWYRYYLPDDYPGITTRYIENKAFIFLGKHDFARFSKPDPSQPDLPTVREVTDIDVTREDGYIILDIKAHSFLWHMVRRMVWTVDKAVRDEISIAQIYNILDEGAAEPEIGLAPPEPLVLMDVSYDNVEFDRIKGVRKKDIVKRVMSLREELKFLDLAVSGFIDDGDVSSE